MPASNLGIVFGPTLLRTSEGSATLSSLVDTVHQTKVIELLIEHADSIFGPPPEPSSSPIVVVAAAATALPNSSSSPAHRSAQSPKVELEGTTSSSSSLLSKVPVVRSISFLEKHRSKSRDAADRDHATTGNAAATAIISTPADRRSHVGSHELREEVLLPGFVADKTPNNSLDIDPLSGKRPTNFPSLCVGLLFSLSPSRESNFRITMRKSRCGNRGDNCRYQTGDTSAI